MMKFVEALLVARENARFQKLVKMGLVARDVVAVQVLGEKKERLALLCKSKDQVFVVVCASIQKADYPSIFILLGHYLQAKNGIILDHRKSDWVELSGRYEGLRAPLVVAEDVTVKKVLSC